MSWTSPLSGWSGACVSQLALGVLHTLTDPSGQVTQLLNELSLHSEASRSGRTGSAPEPAFVCPAFPEGS